MQECSRLRSFQQFRANSSSLQAYCTKYLLFLYLTFGSLPYKIVLVKRADITFSSFFIFFQIRLHGFQLSAVFPVIRAELVTAYRPIFTVVA